VTFEWGEDRELGGHGWIPVDQPNFNASQGFGVAHDTLEHFDLKAGTLEEELMAFGSIFYIRVDSGHMMGRSPMARSPGYIMAGDLCRFLCDAWWRGEHRVLKAYQGRPRHMPDLEADLDEAIHETMKQLRDELDDEQAYRDFKRANPTIKDDLRRWIRAGYWKCKARYGGAPGWRLAEAFDAIEQAVDRHNYAEEGDRLRVTVRMSQAVPAVNVRMLYPEDNYA
jgi:hypothetical protein